jgi:hypothetical protein
MYTLRENGGSKGQPVFFLFYKIRKVYEFLHEPEDEKRRQYCLDFVLNIKFIIPENILISSKRFS